MKLFWGYLLAISTLSVVVTILDKRAARLHALRVPESVLLLLAALGGGAGMFATMLLIRHKTRKPKFMFGIPFIMFCQLLLLLFAVWRWTESNL